MRPGGSGGPGQAAFERDDFHATRNLLGRRGRARSRRTGERRRLIPISLDALIAERRPSHGARGRRARARRRAHDRAARRSSGDRRARLPSESEFSGGSTMPTACSTKPGDEIGLIRCETARAVLLGCLPRARRTRIRRAYERRFAGPAARPTRRAHRRHRITAVFGGATWTRFRALLDELEARGDGRRAAARRDGRGWRARPSTTRARSTPTRRDGHRRRGGAARADRLARGGRHRAELRSSRVRPCREGDGRPRRGPRRQRRRDSRRSGRSCTWRTRSHSGRISCALGRRRARARASSSEARSPLTTDVADQIALDLAGGVRPGAPAGTTGRARRCERARGVMRSGST